MRRRAFRVFLISRRQKGLSAQLFSIVRILIFRIRIHQCILNTGLTGCLNPGSFSSPILREAPFRDFGDELRRQFFIIRQPDRAFAYINAFQFLTEYGRRFAAGI